MLVIERFEDEYAIIENDGNLIKEKKTSIPKDAGEGDILIKIKGEYFVDKEKTKKRREEIKRLQDSLWK